MRASRTKRSRKERIGMIPRAAAPHVACALPELWSCAELPNWGRSRGGATDLCCFYEAAAAATAGDFLEHYYWSSWHLSSAWPSTARAVTEFVLFRSEMMQQQPFPLEHHCCRQHYCQHHHQLWHLLVAPQMIADSRGWHSREVPKECSAEEPASEETKREKAK